MDEKPKLYKFKDGRNAGTVYEIEKTFPEGRLLLRPNPYPNTRDLVAGPIVDRSEIEPV